MAMTFKDVRKMALSLEGVEEGTSYGTAAFKVRGKLIARLKEDGESLVVGTTFEEREEMMAADSEVYQRDPSSPSAPQDENAGRIFNKYRTAPNEVWDQPE